MARTIKAHELGDEHIGARIQYTMNGWTREGELAQVQGRTSYHLYLRAAGGLGSLTVRQGDDVTILEEAPIRHPGEPIGLGAVVEADVGGKVPARWICVIHSWAGVDWLLYGSGLAKRYTWSGIQEEAIAPIRVLSEGVQLDDDDEPETPEVYAGMVITEWPENDEHLRGWVIEDCGKNEWRWDPKEGDLPGIHWRWRALGLPKPYSCPWKVLKKLAEGGEQE